jgi:hypothetical protein
MGTEGKAFRTIVQERQNRKLTEREKKILNAFHAITFDVVYKLLNKNCISKESYQAVKSAIEEKRKEEPMFSPNQAWLRKCAEGIVTKEINNFLNSHLDLADIAYNKALEEKGPENFNESLKRSLEEFYKTSIAKESATAVRKRA